MTTIGEEQPSLSADTFSQFANVDFNNASNFDWLAQQNGGNFDPQLFGDYREPQESILSNPSFDELFNDSLDADFFTPYNVAPSPALHKKNLIDEIDAQKDDFDDKMAKKADMSCNQLWYDLKPSFGSPPDGNTDKMDREKLQACPKAQNGEFDLDGLCSELTKKAKCSGNGPVVGEHDFDTLLKKYMGKDVSSECVAETLGIEVSRASKPNGVNLS
jgi:AP-1-like factor